MDFKKAKVITEETVKQTVEMSGRCDCACEMDQDCACEVMQDCACEAYGDCACEAYSDCACAAVY